MKFVFLFGFFLSAAAFASGAYQCDGGEEPRTVLIMSIAPSHSFDYTPVDKSLPASRGIYVRNTLTGHLFELVDLATNTQKTYLEFPRLYYKKDSFIATRSEVTAAEIRKRSFLCYDLSL